MLYFSCLFSHHTLIRKQFNYESFPFFCTSHTLHSIHDYNDRDQCSLFDTIDIRNAITTKYAITLLTWNPLPVVLPLALL